MNDRRDDRRVEAAVERRVAEIMSSAGMSAARVAHELLYLLPRDFRDVYVELFHAALGGTASLERGGGARETTGGSTEAARSTSGRAQSEIGRVSRGKRPYRKYWVVQDEAALRLKERVDKRLRAMAREMRVELSLSDEARAGIERAAARISERGKLPAGRRKCETCSRFVAIEWRFCPTCGRNLEDSL